MTRLASIFEKVEGVRSTNWTRYKTFHWSEFTVQSLSSLIFFAHRFIDQVAEMESSSAEECFFRCEIAQSPKCLIFVVDGKRYACCMLLIVPC